MHLHDIEMSEPLNPNFDNESFQSEKFATAQKTLQTAERAILAKKWEKAQKFLYKALDQFNLIHNSPMEARVLDLIGRTFEMTFQWNKSLEYYDNALNLKKGPARTQTNPPEIADSYKRIAKIHLQLNNLESARENIQKAIDILDDENMYFAKAESLFILGKIHYLEKEFTSALFYYNLAVDLLYHQYNSELDLELQENLGLLFRR
ncbi:MAG: tetratricopeptide repeat protein, partial [Promethearchaeota archaeon]